MVENGIENLADDKKNKSNDLIVEQHQVLPSNCMPLAHQVAGHFFGKGRTKLGFLQTNDGLVLKPVQSPPRGEREHNFFKKIFSQDESELNEDEKELKNLLPTYRGPFMHNNIMYIKMDDLAYGLKYPAVIDFKIGRQTHDPEASTEKITRQKLKYPPCEKIGFQLLGMRVFNETDKTFSHFDKIFGRALSEENLIHGLALYFQFHQTAQIHAIRETIKKFEEIKKWFEKQTTYHFYSSSLIVVYEANLAELIQTSESVNNNNSNVSASSDQYLIDISNSVRITMADFAHVFPADKSRDENYLYGLNRLIDHLKMLLDTEYTFKDVRNGC